MLARSLIVAVLVLVCCAPAQAATVARSGAFTLQARTSEQGLCLTLRRSRHYQGEECGPLPRSPFRPLRVFSDVGPDTYAAAVPPAVVTVETEDAAGRRARHPTVAARGFAARFILIPDPHATYVRFYGADGALLAIADGPGGLDDFDDARVTVFGARTEGVEAHVEPRIDPTPEQLDRIRTLACVSVANSSGGDGFCDNRADNGLVVLGSCDGQDLVGGVVAAGIAGVRLTLGSGAEVTVPAVELPAAFGGRRAFGAFVPPREAVRSAAAVDAAGQVVASVIVGTPPGGQPCSGPDGGDDCFEGTMAPVTAPTGVAVGPLLVAEQGEKLCATLEPAFAPGDCQSPPVDSESPPLLRRGAIVAGVAEPRRRAGDARARPRPGGDGADDAVRRPVGRPRLQCGRRRPPRRRPGRRPQRRRRRDRHRRGPRPHPVGPRVLAERSGMRLEVFGSPRACGAPAARASARS